MGEALLSRRGGSASKGPIKKGTIVVSYPSGSTCTVTNGSKTYTALDTSGSAAFVVDAGTWTVRAVSGSSTASTSVTVAAQGWAYAELKYELVLWASGNNNTAVTGGWTPTYVQTANSITNVTATSFVLGGYTSNAASVQAISTNNKIDLTQYRTLSFTVSSFSGGAPGSLTLCATSTDPATWLDSSATATMAARLYQESLTAKTYSLDVSAVSGSYYIRAIVGNSSLSQCGINVGAIKLLP